MAEWLKAKNFVSTVSTALPAVIFDLLVRKPWTLQVFGLYTHFKNMVSRCRQRRNTWKKKCGYLRVTSIGTEAVQYAVKLIRRPSSHRLVSLVIHVEHTLYKRHWIQKFSNHGSIKDRNKLLFTERNTIHKVLNKQQFHFSASTKPPYCVTDR